MRLITKDIKPGCLIFEDRDQLLTITNLPVSRALVVEKTVTKIKLFWPSTNRIEIYNLIDIEWFFMSKDLHSWKILCP